MPTEITTALIAATTSILAALFSLIIAIINNRNNVRSAKVIEKLKYDFEQAKTTSIRDDNYLDENLKALQASIQAIQVLKDEMLPLLWNIEQQPDFGDMIQQITVARTQANKTYEENMALLENDETQILHRAKNMGLFRNCRG